MVVQSSPACCLSSLRPRGWGWAAAVTLSVVGTPRLLIYMLTIVARRSAGPRRRQEGPGPRAKRHTDAALSDRIGRRDLVALAILSLIGGGVPLWLAAAAGAIGIPGNDGWVYMRAADTLFRTGSLAMPGHTAASIGQVVTVQPFLWLSGGDPWAFTAYGLVFTLIGVVATYLLARRFVGTGVAVLVVLLVEAFPGFARETVAFMTDVPTFALMMLCLLLGVRWLQGRGRSMELVASIAVGLLALSIREFALAAPAAILVAAWACGRADERAWLAVVSSAFVVGVVLVLVAVASMTGRSVPTTLDIGRLAVIGPAFATLAAVLLPATVLAVG